MTDYERGTASWDIGMVLTRHGNGTIKTENGDFSTCARVLDLRRTAHIQMSGVKRLESALNTACTCGAGDSESEETSLNYNKEARDAAITAGSFAGHGPRRP